VERTRRLPLILGSVALLGSAWFEYGVSGAWRGAFELAGTSYCVTGMPLAAEDRILAWAFGAPVILFSLGLSRLDSSSRAFRHLCWAVIGMAVLGPLFTGGFLIGFIFCAISLRGLLVRETGPSATVLTADRTALLSMAAGILLTETGHLHLLPLGKTADSILVRGELIRAIADLLTLAVPGAALLVSILNLPSKETQAS
jgi:hypothetical protein